MMDKFVYKILIPEDWESFRVRGEYLGSAHDKRDGFIHLSNRAQMQGTLDKHYKDTREVIIIEFEAAKMSEALKYEASRDGALFPHLYGPLDLAHMTQFWPLSAGLQGRYAVADILG